MKLAAAVFCFLLSIVSLLGIIDSTGVLQDAPPNAEQLSYVRPWQAGFVIFGLAGVTLVSLHAKRGGRSKADP